MRRKSKLMIKVKKPKKSRGSLVPEASTKTPSPSTVPCHKTLVKVCLGIQNFSYCIQMSIMEKSQNQFSSCYWTGRDEFGCFFFLPSLLDSVVSTSFLSDRGIFLPLSPLHWRALLITSPPGKGQRKGSWETEVLNSSMTSSTAIAIEGISLLRSFSSPLDESHFSQNYLILKKTWQMIEVIKSECYYR